jgi:hypothetical protein
LATFVAIGIASLWIVVPLAIITKPSSIEFSDGYFWVPVLGSFALFYALGRFITGG